ncbi:hypothetical protein ACFVFS_14295 [Kitasatospora sp. NPDC057692]|uniref:hypothetical protein n=1 Tax=Kitasatospora sp. NPDC057692 TaxID=3346215 RepID=UPI0036A00175
MNVRQRSQSRVAMPARRVAAALGMAGTLVGAVLGGAAPASAAAQGTAPACVERAVFKPQHEAYITNGCGKNMKLKVIINNGPDSSCHTLRNGQYFYYWWPFGSYARTVTC